MNEFLGAAQGLFAGSFKERLRCSAFWMIASVVGLGATVAPGRGAAEEASCSIAASALSVAAEIRNLKALRPVPCKKQSKDGVRRYLEEKLTKEYPQARLRAEERVYKLLGLIPESYDYSAGLIKLYTDQIGGYYDPQKEYYAMASWMPASMQMPIAIHELTHALQDQHYNLDLFLDHKQQTSDQALGGAALIEGDAMAVMLDFTRRGTRQGSIANDPSALPFLTQNLLGMMFTSTLREAPPALQSLLIFPYLTGLNFAHTLLREGGYGAIDRAFQSPPMTSEEVLHPAKYLSRIARKSVSGGEGSTGEESVKVKTPPPPASGSAAELLLEDSLGEFFISTLLGTQLPPHLAARAAAGWRGDQLALYKTPTGHLLLWHSTWDTQTDAEEFFTAIKEASTKRFGETLPSTSSPLRFGKHGAIESTTITLDHHDVMVEVRGEG